MMKLMSGATLNTSRRGCFVFRGLQPGEGYQAMVTTKVGGQTAVFGSETRRAPRTERFSLGTVRVG